MSSRKQEISKLADRHSVVGRLLAPRLFRRAMGIQRRGAAAVEFAVVAPVFVLMIFGMIEVSRGIMVKQIMTNAAREGARAAILDGATGTDVTTSVNTYLSNCSLAAATVTFPQGLPEAVTYGNPVEVQVSLSYTDVSWLPIPRYMSSSSLTASSVMRRETND